MALVLCFKHLVSVLSSDHFLNHETLSFASLFIFHFQYLIIFCIFAFYYTL